MSICRLLSTTAAHHNMRPMSVCRLLSTTATHHTMRPMSVCRLLSTTATRQAILRSHAEDVQTASRPIFEMVWERRTRWANRTAYIDCATEKSLTYNETYRNVLRLSDALSQRDYGHGDVVAACLPNCLELPMTVHACMARGMATTTLNPLYTEDDMVRQFEISGARAVVTSPPLLPVVRAAAARVPSVREIITTDGAHSDGVVNFPDLLRQGREVTPTLDVDMKKDPVLLLFSSGTTGLPKGVTLTNYCLGTNLLQGISPECLWESSEHERLLAVLPMFHAYAMYIFTLRSLLIGASTTLLHRFEPEMFLDAVRKYQPTSLHLVPPLVSFLANHPTVDHTTFPALRVVICGAAPLGESAIKRFRSKVKKQLSFVEAWGMTECSTLISISSVSKGTLHGSCGVLAPNTELKVVSVEDGRELGEGGSGELWVRGPQLMRDYYNNPEATAEAVDADGWLHSGDIGYYDRNGFIFVVDRVKELIKYKAFQVAPAVLEELLRKHDAVLDAAVIGLPDEEAGELPRAYVVPRNTDVTEEELATYVNGQVNPHYQLRGGVRLVDSIPKSAAGKTLRRELKEMAVRELAKTGGN